MTASHADPALEALLPAEISGTPMQRSSATLAALVAAGANRTAIDGFLQGIGKSESDGSYAAAFDPANAVGGGIFAFKVAGVDAGVLLPAILAVEQSDLGAGATTTKANVGGKDVTVVSVGTGVNDTEGLLTAWKRDHAPDEAHAAAYLQRLPPAAQRHHGAAWCPGRHRVVAAILGLLGGDPRPPFAADEPAGCARHVRAASGRVRPDQPDGDELQTAPRRSQRRLVLPGVLCRA